MSNLNTNPQSTYNNESNFVIEDSIFSDKQTDGLSLRDCQNVTIRRCTFKNLTGEGIRLHNCEQILIENCVFNNIRTGVYATNSKNIQVLQCDCQNVQGPMPRGQFVQLNQCSGTENRISFNIIENILGQSNAEDVINLYKTIGSGAGYVEVTNNYIKGGGPSSSGGGIMTGDNGGKFQYVEGNILVDPGQYGIGCAGGENIVIVNNQVYGKQQPFTNVGIYAWKQRAPTAKNVFIADNKISWTNKDGVSNPTWKGNNVDNLVIEDNETVEYTVPPIPSNWGVQDTPVSENVATSRVEIWMTEDRTMTSLLESTQDFPSSSHSIVYVPKSDLDIAKVQFFVNDELVQTEGIPPYAIAGDSHAGYTLNPFNQSIQTLTIKALGDDDVVLETLDFDDTVEEVIPEDPLTEDQKEQKDQKEEEDQKEEDASNRTQLILWIVIGSVVFILLIILVVMLMQNTDEPPPPLLF